MSGSLTADCDTIVAIATPSGRGGIGIIRLSGPLAQKIIQVITDCELKPRHAQLTAFSSGNTENRVQVDKGIALFFCRTP